MIRRQVAPRGARLHLAVVTGCFFGLRALLWATGLRFEDHLTGQLQLLDEKVLTADPFAAFTQNSIQPPLWNFYVGAVRAWSPLPAALSFQLVWVAADLATVTMLWWLLTRLGARRWQATVAAVLVAVNPLLVSSESFLRYETAVTFLVTASVYTFARYVDAPGVRRFAMFSVVLMIGVGTRTLLQPLWLLGGLALGIAVAHRAGKSTLRFLWPAAVVLMVVVADLVFVGVRFGNVGFSSYAGVNLKRVAVTTLPQDTLERLQREGKLSALAAIKPYSVYEVYARADGDLGHCIPTRTGSAAGVPRKSTGEANLNYLCFRRVYDQAFDDAVAAIRAEPGNYLKSVGQATVVFVSWPAPFDRPRSDAFRRWESLYKPVLVPLGVHFDVGGSRPQPTTAFMVAGMNELPVLVTMAAALGYTLWRSCAAAWRIAARRRRGPVDTTWLWIGYTVVSVTLAGVTLDFYENARFRQALDPILLGSLVVAVAEATRSVVLRVVPGRAEVDRAGTGLERGDRPVGPGEAEGNSSGDGID